MGNESYHSDDGEGKDIGKVKGEIAVESGEKNEEKSLSELYRSVCSRARQAQGFSKKKEIERACEEYEASLNMIDDAEKRRDLNKHYRELFEKARTEIEKHYKLTLTRMLKQEKQEPMKRKSEDIPLIRPSPTENGEFQEETGASDQEREGIIRIGEEPGSEENRVVVDDGEAGISRRRDERTADSTSESRSGRTRVSHSEESILEDEDGDAASSSEKMTIKELLSSDDTITEKQMKPLEAPEQPHTPQPGTAPPQASGEQARYGLITKPNEEPALLPVLLKRLNTGSLFKTRRRKIAAALVAVLLLLVVLGALSTNPEKMTVQIPSKKIGDTAEYEVEGSLSADSETTFETTIGLLSGFNIEFNGFLAQQVNDTTTVKDGFDESHKALEEYINQNLDMEGTIGLVGLNPKLRDGKLITHQTDYTDLSTNKTIHYKFSNIFRITIPTTDPPFSREIHSIDKGTFFTSSAQSPTILTFLRSDFQENLLPDKVREGDRNTNEEYNL